jgi:hypothetical protein
MSDQDSELYTVSMSFDTAANGEEAIHKALHVVRFDNVEECGIEDDTAIPVKVYINFHTAEDLVDVLPLLMVQPGAVFGTCLVEIPSASN